jgi:hypothetical protein
MTAGFVPAFFISYLSFIQIKFPILFLILIVILILILVAFAINKLYRWF